MKQTVIFLILIFFSFEATSQIGNSDSIINENEALFLKKRVKNLDEFIHRFNGDYSYLGDSINKLSRDNKLKLLIDYNTYGDSTLIEQFIKSITSNDFVLNYKDENWYASVKYLVKYQRKTETIEIQMQISSDDQGQMKWIIANVHLPFLEKPHAENKTDLFINPVNNEVGFSRLTKYLKSKNAKRIVNESFEYDHLSIFLFLLDTNQLEIDQLKEITYIFYTSKYCFNVKNFNREDGNAGWLIASFIKNNNKKPIFNRSDLIIQAWEKQNEQIQNILYNVKSDL